MNMVKIKWTFEFLMKKGIGVSLLSSGVGVSPKLGKHLGTRRNFKLWLKNDVGVSPLSSGFEYLH